MREDPEAQTPSTETVEPKEEPQGQPATGEEAPKPKRQVSEADIAALQSKYDKRMAALEKTAQEAEKRASEREAEVERLRAEYDLARQYGDNEDAKAAAKKLLEREQSLKAKERELKDYQRQLAEHAKAIKAAEFSKEYGIPADDLLDAKTVEEMELKALRFKIQQQGATGAKPATEEPKPKPQRKPGYDTGEATRKPASFLTEKDPQKAAAMWEQLKRDAWLTRR